MNFAELAPRPVMTPEAAARRLERLVKLRCLMRSLPQEIAERQALLERVRVEFRVLARSPS